jgi:hypothetical protein
MASESLSIP